MVSYEERFKWEAMVVNVVFQISRKYCHFPHSTDISQKRKGARNKMSEQSSKDQMMENKELDIEIREITTDDGCFVRVVLYDIDYCEEYGSTRYVRDIYHAKDYATAVEILPTFLAV